VRGPAFGIPSLRVDGNDLLACYIATKKAKEIVLETKGPVLLELMTYRVGAHSTSDNPLFYRQSTDTDYWIDSNNPRLRLEKFLKYKN